MALKAKLETLDGLPDEIASHYTEQDGAFVLSVERVDGLGIANADKLEGALSKERKTVSDLQKIVKKIPEGKSIDDLLGDSTKLGEIGDLSELEDLDEKLATRTKQLEDKFASDRAALDEKFTGDIAAKDKQISALTDQLHGEIVRGTALKAITDNGGVPELLLPVVMNSVKVEHDESTGQMVARVVDANGQNRLSSKAGSIDPMSIGEFVSEMRGSETYSVAFKGEDAGGGGTNKPGGGGGSGAHRISNADAKDHEKYKAAVAAANEAGVPLEMVD